MMRTSLIGGTATAAILVAGAAFAQAAKPTQPAPRVAKTEARADVQANVARMFTRLDSNHDGFIAKDEVAALEAQRAQKTEERAKRFDPDKIFDRIDANRDGKITVAEEQAARNARIQAKGGTPAVARATAFGGLFARVDANKDKVVTRAEFDAMGTQLRARMEHAGMRGGFGERMFGTADVNKDGRVSLAEAQQLALQHFDRADVNHDGKLTPDERKQSRQLVRAQRKPS
jgi:Ca2+-binding EF-hand superfamily protein